ncbi:membrane protein insertase YidC [Candidatus Sumerlaeota bacterium]|nr:membrane protein insertase YidC [Candidatus Sumerlaeota bacterium]
MDMERRIILFMVLSVSILLLFSMMQSQKPVQPPPTSAPTSGEQGVATTPVSAYPEQESKPGLTPSEFTEPQEIETLNFDEAEKIIVHTKNYYVTFSTLGARPISWLVNPKNSVNEKSDVLPSTSTMVELIPQWLPFSASREFPFDITLLEYGGGIHNEFRTMLYQAQSYVTPEGERVIEFTSPPNRQNVRVKKIFAFPPEGYMFKFSVKVLNEGDAKLVFDNDGLGMSIIWGAGLGSRKGARLSADMRYFRAIFRVGKKVKKVTPKLHKAFSYFGNIIWGGLESRFYLAVLISPDAGFKKFATTVKERNLIGLSENELKHLSRLVSTAELSLPRFVLEPGKSYEQSVETFVGPKYYDVLQATGYGLQKSLFGWLRPFCVILLKIMQVFYKLTSNYGWSIILLTIVVRVVAYPLTIKGMRIQAKAMAEQQRIRPLIEALNQKYKDNPALKNKKLMELYKEHGINPLAPLRGCLPMLVQMPIFFALYILLIQAIELKGQSFLWITDLSGPDKLLTFNFSLPFLGSNLNLLPILMGASQFFISKISSPGGAVDPMQRQMALLFPIFFTVLLYNFPAGLILYWLVSNVLQVGQQLIVNKYVKEHLSEQQHKSKS